jgi:hypothetical protein
MKIIKIKQLTTINLTRFFLLACTMTMLLSACEKSKSEPEQAPEEEPIATPEDCRIQYFSTNQGNNTDSIVYEYDADRIVKIKYFNNKWHQLDIILQYPDDLHIQYKVHRKELNDFVSISGTATLKNGLIQQIDERSLYLTQTIYNMEYTKEGYLLRIRTGDPERGLQDFQDFAYRDGNLTAVYNSFSGEKMPSEIAYGDIPMQGEIADYMIPFAVHQSDMRLAFLAFYKSGWLGKKSKSMPQTRTDHLGSQMTRMNYFTYNQDQKGKITKFSHRVEYGPTSTANYIAKSEVNYQCK